MELKATGGLRKILGMERSHEDWSGRCAKEPKRDTNLELWRFLQLLVKLDW